MYTGEKAGCKDVMADIIFSIRCLEPSGSACRLLVVIGMHHSKWTYVNVT